MLYPDFTFVLCAVFTSSRSFYPTQSSVEYTAVFISILHPTNRKTQIVRSQTETEKPKASVYVSLELAVYP